MATGMVPLPLSSGATEAVSWWVGVVDAGLGQIGADPSPFMSPNLGVVATGDRCACVTSTVPCCHDDAGDHQLLTCCCAAVTMEFERGWSDLLTR